MKSELERTVNASLVVATIASLLQQVDIPILSEVVRSSDKEGINNTLSRQAKMILFFAQEFQQLDDVEVNDRASQILKEIDK